MKKLIAGFLVVLIGHVNADVDFVPLDMALGYWETTTKIDASEMMATMLANIPEEQREAVRGMMESKMKLPVTKQCVTKETFENMESKLKESLSGHEEMNCDFEVVTSTSKVFSGVFSCEGNSTRITTTVINSKRHESKLVTNMGGIGQNEISTVGEWKSSTCPENI